MKSISEIRTAYHSGAIRSRAAALAVARLFPCLARLYPQDYNAEEWTPEDLSKVCGKLSTGEAECAKFVLMVYNYSLVTATNPRQFHGLKCGLFNIVEAVSHWGNAEKAVLVEWINNPLYL